LARQREGGERRGERRRRRRRRGCRKLWKIERDR
jgi:hypothetical protein